MLTQALIDTVRKNFLDDDPVDTTDRLWSDVHLLLCANEAEREATRRAKLLLDKTHATANDINTGSATSTSAGHLVDTAAAFVSADVVGKTVYNLTDNTWTTVSGFNSGTDLTLAADIMASGEQYIIGDPAKALTRICVVSGTASYLLSTKVIKIQDSAYLASDGSRVYQKTEGWLDANYSGWRTATGTPLFYIEDKGLITLVPKPDDSLNQNTGKDTLILTPWRLPLRDMTLTGSSSPEIPEEYHLALIDGICELAYGKQDAQAYDERRAEIHAARFTMKFGPPVSALAENNKRKLPSHFKISGPKW